MIRRLRNINIVLAFMATLMLVGVYAQKHMAETTADEVRSIEDDIARQRAALSILKADWAYLNQPTQLQAIVDRHNETLNLHVPEIEQFGTFAELPMRPEMRLDTQSLDALFESIETESDPIGSLLEGIL
ncbi:hypothetical protein [Pelagibacterium halotolerans]|uniref:cell division protein FtsL n=1 Tax=Pelagibacterium halotolerans TaxID=531813 RepID=UPI003850A480